VNTCRWTLEILLIEGRSHACNWLITSRKTVWLLGHPYLHNRPADIATYLVISRRVHKW